MDWLAGVVTYVSLELIARRRWEGWAVGLVNCVLWTCLVVDRELWGLLPLQFLLAWRYGEALYRWRSESQREQHPC